MSKMTEGEARVAVAKEASKKRTKMKAVWMEAWIQAQGVEKVDNRAKAAGETAFRLWWENNME